MQMGTLIRLSLLLERKVFSTEHGKYSAFMKIFVNMKTYGMSFNS